MKKIYLVPLAALILGSCSNNDITTGGEDENVSKSFLTVKLASPYGTTRADYVDGYATENNINSIRFYFFYDNGEPTPVMKPAGSDSYRSFIEWYPADNDNDQQTDLPEGNTVEKIVETTIGINQPVGTAHPNLVLAVINPPSVLTNYTGSLNLDNIKNLVSDYYTDLHDNNFVITNSVYVDENKNIISATPISEDNLKPTPDDPDLKKLVIYVERVLARIDLQLNLTNQTMTVTPSDGGSPYTIYRVSEQKINGDEQDIYIRLLGWNVAQYTNTSRLVKDINVWPSNLFGDNQPWNIFEYHRSFWAINPQDVTYTYNTFVHIPGTDYPYASKLAIPENGKTASPVYVQENAADYKDAEEGTGAVNPTSLVFAAQLVNANGTPLELVKWANKYYSITGALNTIANSLSLWYKTETTQDGKPGTLYTHIKPEDLRLVSAEELYGDNPLPDDVAEYYVFVQLTEAAQAKDWYQGNTPDSPGITPEAANKLILDSTSHLYVWNKGEAYYFIDVRHLGYEGSPGYWGIVRNHIYNINLTLIEGLGTPVFNPDETFHPQTPTTDENVISAEVRILQWRVVSQNYTIKW